VPISGVKKSHNEKIASQNSFEAIITEKFFKNQFEVDF